MTWLSTCKDFLTWLLVRSVISTSDATWKDFRATRQWSRKEISTHEAYKILYPDNEGVSTCNGGMK
jgi:hypothetical protein